MSNASWPCENQCGRVSLPLRVQRWKKSNMVPAIQESLRCDRRRLRAHVQPNQKSVVGTFTEIKEQIAGGDNRPISAVFERSHARDVRQLISGIASRGSFYHPVSSLHFWFGNRPPAATRVHVLEKPPKAVPSHCIGVRHPSRPIPIPGTFFSNGSRSRSREMSTCCIPISSP